MVTVAGAAEEGAEEAAEGAVEEPAAEGLLWLLFVAQPLNKAMESTSTNRIASNDFNFFIISSLLK